MHMHTTIKELMDLGGKVAVVTGGAKGIGAAIALRLAEAGADIVIADMDDKAGGETVERIQDADRKAVFVRTDVSEDESIKALFERVKKDFGRVDILVNNAGIYPTKPVTEVDVGYFEEVVHTNVLSTVMCTRYVSEMMRDGGKGGRIINVASVNGISAGPKELSVYTASKHAVWGFTRASALELAEHKIWVNAVAPGYVETPGTKEDIKEDPAEGIEEREQYMEEAVMKRTGKPDDIGKAALFLCSGLADYMTGSLVVVDGGLLLS